MKRCGCKALLYAPGQIPETLSQVTPPVNVQALGIDSGAGVFFHGATAGLEYSF